MSLAGTHLIITSSLPSAGMCEVIVDSLNYTPTFEQLLRSEFDNGKQKAAPNICGQVPILGSNLFGRPYQVDSDCAELNARPLGPNSDTNFNRIAKKFKIKRVNVQGAVSESADIAALYLIAENHQVKLAKFQKYVARLADNLPYDSLIALQSESFSYLTTTGVTVVGTAIDTTDTNILITNFTVDNQFSIPTNAAGTNREFYKSYSLTYEMRVLANLDA